jgi:hypothetical protein
MKHLALFLTLGVTLGVAGCTEEEDPTEAFCTSFGAGATYQWTACNAGCTLANSALAHDQSLTTTATIVPVDGQTTYTAVLTATAAADIPGGADGGVFVTQPNFQNFQTMNSTLRTIRDGVQQETLNPGGANDVTSPSESGTPAAGFLGMRTTQAFDQVEFTATVTWNAGQAPNYSVYEICADGGNI